MRPYNAREAEYARQNLERLKQQLGDAEAAIQRIAAFYKDELPICGARCRDGHSCQAKAAWNAYKTAPCNGRCRIHGGLSTGPRTPEGKGCLGALEQRT